MSPLLTAIVGGIIGALSTLVVEVLVFMSIKKKYFPTGIPQ